MAFALAVNLAFAGGLDIRSAYACACARIPAPEKELRTSDAVFVGKAVESGPKYPDPEDNAQFGGIGFEVSESWKGVSRDSVVIYGQSESYYEPLEEGKVYTVSDCAVDITKGKSYLVFASRLGGEDFLTANACGNTATLAGAEDDLEPIGPPDRELPETGGFPASLTGIIAVAILLAGGFFVRRGRGGSR